MDLLYWPSIGVHFKLLLLVTLIYRGNTCPSSSISNSLSLRSASPPSLPPRALNIRLMIAHHDHRSRRALSKFIFYRHPHTRAHSHDILECPRCCPLCETGLAYYPEEDRDCEAVGGAEEEGPYECECSGEEVG